MSLTRAFQKGFLKDLGFVLDMSEWVELQKMATPGDVVWAGT